jgi:hypothetical protein
VQDPVEPRLLFLGTENGLWVSIDEGTTWTRWTSGYPAGVPTMDLVIHPREHDLVIGTFGRALYVLDDIRPLRELAKSSISLFNKGVHIFTPPDAYRVEIIQPAGPRFDADAVYNGQNRSFGALITYLINKPEDKKEIIKSAPPTDKKSGKKSDDKRDAGATKEEIIKDDKSSVKYDSLILEVFNAQGVNIRTIRQKSPEENGVHRINWNLDEKGERAPSREKPRPNISEQSGVKVLPGAYKLRLSFGGQKDSSTVVVKDDPRYNTSPDILEARYKLLKDLDNLMAVMNLAADRLRESKELAENFDKKMKDAKRNDVKELTDKTKAVKDSINTLFDLMLGKEDKRQGITEGLRTPISYISNARNYISSSRQQLTTTDDRVFKHAREKINGVITRVNHFYNTYWKEYRTAMEKVSLPYFKDYPALLVPGS